MTEKRRKLLEHKQGAMEEARGQGGASCSKNPPWSSLEQTSGSHDPAGLLWFQTQEYLPHLYNKQDNLRMDLCNKTGSYLDFLNKFKYQISFEKVFLQSYRSKMFDSYLGNGHYGFCF